MFNPQIRIERDENDCARKVWVFRFHEYLPGLVVGAFFLEARATKRHKFKATEAYFYNNTRQSSLTIDDVPFPEDVQAEALGKLRDSLKIAKEFSRR